ncbi:MAG: DUF2461 domain-containing protein [Deltaproteobacteria bacterium]|nr:DUF2461 domain-containing protein [Deltaproteobacteria bacterium]
MAFPVFKGFPRQTLTFFQNLAQDNSKRWFDAHRREYEDYVLTPARDLVLELGERLKKIAPGIVADPRVNQSLFRLNRDIRFSPDKTPYKTHLALWFWEGSRPRMECSGFYLHLEPGRLMLGSGIYCFPKDLLEIYRQSVIHPKYGKALREVVAETTRQPNYTLGGQHYKKTPAGFDSRHPNAEFLLYNGLYAGREMPIRPELYTPELIDLCFETFQGMLPLHRWLLALTRRVPLGPGH